MTDETPTLLTEDILGEFGFRVVWSYQTHWADVKVYEIVARGCGNAPYFPLKDAKGSDDQSIHIEEAETYAEGFVKWDGCAELSLGHHHFCGQPCFAKHCALVKYLWSKARELVGDDAGMDETKWSDYSA